MTLPRKGIPNTREELIWEIKCAFYAGALAAIKDVNAANVELIIDQTKVVMDEWEKRHGTPTSNKG